jgi:fused signal recognition particle receptor
MAEEKKGFFKKLFRFGKKKREDEPEVDASAAEAEAAALAQQEAEKQAAAEAKVQAELKAAEEEIARRAAEEKAAAEAEAARLKEEQEAAQKAAKEQAEAERIAAEEEAKRIAADKAELEKREAEEKAQREAEAKALKEAEEKARLEAETAAKKAEEAQKSADVAAAQKAAEEQAEAERLQKEAEAAAEKAEQERKAAEEAAALEKKREEERAEQEEAERKAKAEADRLAAEAERLEQEKQAAAQAEKEAAELLAQEEAQRAAEEKQAIQERAAQEQANLAQQQPEPEPEPEQPEKKSWFKRLKSGLARSSSQLTENISAVFTKRKLDEDTLQELEDILIQADLGVETAMNITDALASQRMGKDVTDEEVREFMATEIEKVLDPVAAELELDLDHTPHVMLVVGVNGSGKTTTIGKLSQKLYDAGFSTLLVAGDTFRAAAIEQLKIWGERTQSPTLSRPLGSDAAGLAFDAYQQAKDEGRDVMLMDTAGRLQNKTELMDELEKIIRVLKKQDPTAPHTVLLTLDATTGQNALNQVEIFKDVSGVNGLVMTKLDGTARGGIMVAIASKFKLPVYFLGVGEQVEDLEPFEARDFARSIAGLEDN